MKKLAFGLVLLIFFSSVFQVSASDGWENRLQNEVANSVSITMLKGSATDNMSICSEIYDIEILYINNTDSGAYVYFHLDYSAYFQYTALPKQSVNLTAMTIENRGSGFKITYHSQYLQYGTIRTVIPTRWVELYPNVTNVLDQPDFALAYYADFSLSMNNDSTVVTHIEQSTPYWLAHPFVATTELTLSARGIAFYPNQTIQTTSISSENSNWLVPVLIAGIGLIVIPMLVLRKK